MESARALVLLLPLACSSPAAEPARESARAGETAAAAAEVASPAAAFLAQYSRTFQELSTAAAEAEWATNTHIVEGDETNARRLREAKEALARFTGDVQNIERARGLLGGDGWTELERRQLEAVLYRAAEKPQTVPDAVRALIAAEARQIEELYGFRFTLDGVELTPNAIDEALKSELDLDRRQAVWECSKEVGSVLREGLLELRGLRNQTVRALGFPDYHAYKVSAYGMSSAEMGELLLRINRELRPLYRELHTWARHELAARYGESVPDLLPAHWLPNRWGQDWSALLSVPGLDLDAALRAHPPEWLVEQAERFYVSLGFEPLPPSFWERSSLYPAPAGAAWKKNTHASAWHIDLERDVRSLMSVEPNTEWYETTHHELGHVYYYLAYSRPEVPVLLREGANRAYHEAIGSLLGLAAMQPRFLASVGLAPEGAQVDATSLLLKEALNYVVFIPWSTGTMTHFEQELYADELPAEILNARWWDLVARYQGIAPPEPRDERWCDAATKTHVNDDPAEYYDYALSFVLLFQLHDHVARELLHEDPHDTNYYGRREVGELLERIMRPGASVDWRALLIETTGSDLSARAMLDYFDPLMDWLREQNRGRVHTLGEI
jgi:peptidyl-dipeptidase A